MPALDTARAVLRWALRPRGAPPAGDLRHLHLLVGAAGVAAELGDLARVCGARLRLDPVPLGDPRPPGPAAAWLAAAVGGAVEASALEIAGAARPRSPAGAWDLVARHGVVAAALPHLRASYPALLADLLLASPLTAVLAFPAPGQDAVATALGLDLAKHRDGRRALVLALSAPSQDPPTLAWRRAFLQRARHEDPALVLEIYQAATVDPSFWLAKIGAASPGLSRLDLGAGGVEGAMALAGYWRVLFDLRRVMGEDAWSRRVYPDAVTAGTIHAFVKFARGLRGGEAW